ncbi:MAG: family 43 glycosylhydrolase [Candidatus Marinimicrobia bacterium]|nr:family 43 glycosylhydrolase [Candidatus Neomarinimicrobiota bacterium]MCF7829338.1 family 43 glycosylhydrolase [Candidatus Neomarinimicrobiota bacterium]MCF7880000.1 family 43 glycosylhydrolase [Candidatus Neomarinimicrobiota bacterium]
MRDFRDHLVILSILLVSAAFNLYAQNPIITDQFTADPSARVFEGKVYLYPSHDILATEELGRVGWFCMEDYHVFSASNLTDWTDHGVIVSQYDVPWVDSTAYSLWAPDCIERNRKYYFYFPAPPKDQKTRRGFSIGVAVSDKPYGPFTPEPHPIEGVRGIDPNPFIDKDGQAYLYWSAGDIYVAKLKANMLELASEPKIIDNLPEEGLKEGPYMFERNGVYYLTYPHVEHQTERIEYAIGDSPIGPFHVTGVIMDESPNCWTNHQSIIEYHDQWYLFYHHNDLSPEFDKNRSVRIDSLFFNEDGTIQKVTPTLRGVGITNASQKIQIDRYSHKSDAGATIEFNDTNDTSAGWKAILDEMNAWIQYNSIDFGNKEFQSVSVRAVSAKGDIIRLKLNDAGGPVLADVEIPADAQWKIITTPVSGSFTGVQNLVVTSKGNNRAEIDWVRFE